MRVAGVGNTLASSGTSGRACRCAGEPVDLTVLAVPECIVFAAGHNFFENLPTHAAGSAETLRKDWVDLSPSAPNSDLATTSPHSEPSLSGIGPRDTSFGHDSHVGMNHSSRLSDDESYSGLRSVSHARFESNVARLQ